MRKMNVETGCVNAPLESSYFMQRILWSCLTLSDNENVVKLGDNFINILHTHFLYERRFPTYM